mmetsp:Transcript_30165/g.42740  ORF Transcript_30165/g.42740 Transcript_30165/m.42740 type:complete len:335 (+) Transcript_30165:2-1006(+)
MNLENIVDRITVMRKQEETDYLYSNYLPDIEASPKGKFGLNRMWREKICHWSYNVVDHFDLGREVVAISLDLFDRFLATRGNSYDGNMALLTSLTTLHLAIKLHAKKKIRISTLAALSRSQFKPSHIEDMEWEILNALSWKLHPPTAYSFVFHFLLFLPVETSQPIRMEMYDLSRYLTELATCDPFFVQKKSSVIAFAAILTVVDQIPFSRFSAGSREALLTDLSERTHHHHLNLDIMEARERLTLMFASSSNPADDRRILEEIHPLNEVNPNATNNGSQHRGNNIRCNKEDSKNSFRYSPKPRGSRTRGAASPISGKNARARISSSPLVVGVR